MKKTIKRIVALGMGATMLGATLMSAGAAGLNAFPAPFIQGGAFSGVLVVGDNAAAEDVVGVSDIAMALQFASSVKAGSSGSTQTTSVTGDAYRVDDNGDALNIYQPLSGVTTVLDDSDLGALADGTFRAKNVVDYTQTIDLPSIQVEWTTDDDADIEDPALFLYFPSGTTAFTYNLDFTTAAESDLDGTNLEDFEDEKITLLGKEYTMTQAQNKTNGESKLTLMSGAIQDTLEVGQTKTYTIDGKDYEVTVMIVSGDVAASAVTKFIINDEVTTSLSADETYDLADGLQLGIKEVLPTKSGDVVQNLVEFFLGADKIVLDGETIGRLEIGEETINDVVVTVDTDVVTAGEVRLNSIDIVWTPTEDYYVPVGGRLSEVLDDDDYIAFLSALGIDYLFGGLEASDSEELRFYGSGDDNYKIKFTNRKGVQYDQKVFQYNSSLGTYGPVSLGDDAGDPLFVNEGKVACDNDYFVVEFNKNSRILQLTDVSSADSTISVKDRGTGETTEASYNSLGISTFTFDGATYTVNVTNTTADCVNLTNIAADSGDTVADLWTEFDTKISLYGGNVTAGFPAHIVMEEDDDNQEDSNTKDTLYWNFSRSTSDGLMLDTFASTTMSIRGGTTGSGSQILIDLDSNDNENQGMTQWGNYLVQKSTDDQDDWRITITEDEAVAEVYLTAGATSVVTTGGATGEAVVLNRIDVGATKLASEVAGLEASQNTLLVGGPCANAAVEAASSDFPTCADWPLDPGEAIIQMVTHANGNVAMLVAGTLAQDTRAATKLAAEMTDLQALPDGTMTQVLKVSTGVLVDFVAPAMEDDS